MSRGAVLWALMFLVAVGGACRFMPDHAYWIESLGRGQTIDVGAWPAGAVAVGTDSRLYTYPGPWGRPWLLQGPPDALKTVSASATAIYAILADGQVVRFRGNQWMPVAGAIAAGASEIAAVDEDRLLVVLGGKLRLLEGNELKATPCEALTVATVGGATADDAYVVDNAGAVFWNHAGRCDRVDAPVVVQKVDATADRLIAVGVDGTVWRRRDAKWTRLPAPLKYRPGRAPFPTQARDVAVSDYATFILDNEGSVFVLSDEA